MGRQDISATDNQGWVFNRIATFYRHRPPYPAELVDAIASFSEASGGVADLGAGTGSLALPLAQRGLNVTAVEPAALMLDELRETARQCALNITCVHACAEATGLASGQFGLVVVADALHWLDPQRAGREIARLLGARGACVVVEVRLLDTPLMQAVCARLQRANPKACFPKSSKLAQLMTHGVPRARTRASLRFESQQEMSSEQLCGTLQSMSFLAPALGPSATAALLDEIVQMVLREGTIQWSREFRVSYWAR